MDDADTVADGCNAVREVATFRVRTAKIVNSKWFCLDCYCWIGLFCVWGCWACPAGAQEPVRIYIGNDDHTDLMWSADQSTYENAFVDMLNFHMELADRTAGNKPPFRNRFNADGHYWIWSYQHKQSAEQFARLIARIKDGTISAPLNAVVSCYGGQPLEAMLRGMYYPGRLERKFDLRFKLAVAMENQTLPLGLASVFAGCGAKYSWRGVCGCATRMSQETLRQRPHEIYWWTGADGQRLLLKWHSLAPGGGNQRSGGYAESFDPVSAIQYLDSDALFLQRYRSEGSPNAYNVRAAFGFGWDALNRKTGQTYAPDPKNYPRTDHFHLIAERESNAIRQVIVSNEEDFFKDFETHYGRTLASRVETYGNEWDLYSASMSETTARVKRAVEKLRSAELMAALVALKRPESSTRFASARDQAYRSLGLYWEHNWTADGPITRNARASWQNKLADQIDAYVENLYQTSLQDLGKLIPRPAAAFRFFVLNPLSWARTEHADIDYGGPPNIHVVDVATGQEVHHQLCEIDRRTVLRILASDVPAVGYRVFEIRPGPPSVSYSAAASASGDSSVTIEHQALRMVIERDGAISSLLDKENGRVELAASVNDAYINDLAAGTTQGSPIAIENAGPVSITVRCSSSAGIGHSTTITLYRNSKRVDVVNEIRENFDNTLYWSFSFALPAPSVFSEEVGAINLNKLKSMGGHYADNNARYDHITVNHFADIYDPELRRGVTVSNPDLAFARLGNSSPTTLDVKTPQINFLAGGQVDGPGLGIPAQYGCTHFLQRFALKPHTDYDATAAMRFALEHQNPLVTGSIDGNEGVTYPQDSYSLLSVSDPNVLLWALKVHDDGLQRGVVARLWNLSNTNTQAQLTFTPGLSGAARISHIETDIEPIEPSSATKLPMTFAPQQIQSYRIELPR